MARRPWEPILEYIRALAAARPDVPACDAELLSRFVGWRDEAAFESLLRRHGPMVLRVARRVLGNEADAEDIFQATFLLLARRASAIRKRESVASWLHGVAHRLAASMRSKRRKRQTMEKRAAEARPTETPTSSAWSELEATLHEVLAQLPAKYRTPLVYCYLEGWTQEEVARDLGVPLGTLRSWVARGRELLRKRLLRRGITLSTAGASSALLASACATAEVVPISLRLATLQTAHLFAAGGNVMTLTSPQIALLVRRGMAALLVAKLKGGAACFLALALLVAGTGWAAHRTFGAKPPEPNEATEKAPPKQAASEERPRVDAHGDPLPPGAVARLGTVRFRHEGGADSLIFSSDGRFLAAKCWGSSIILWDAKTGVELRRFQSVFSGPHIGPKIAFSRDSKILAAPGDSEHIYLWDTATGKTLRKVVLPEVVKDLTGRCDVGQICFSHDGKLLAVGGGNNSYVLDVVTGKPLHHFKKESVSAIAFSPDDKNLVMGVWNGQAGQTHKLVVRSARTGEVLRRLGEHPHIIDAILFSPDGKWMATSSRDRIICWEAATGKVRKRIEQKKAEIIDLAFTPDGKSLVSASEEGKICIWDVATGEQRRQFDVPTHPLRSMALSPDGESMALGNWSSAIRLYDLAFGRELLAEPAQHHAEVLSVAFSPDGKRLASGGKDRQILIWDAATGKAVRQLPGGSTRLVVFSPDGKWLAASGSYGSDLVRVWDVGGGTKPRNLSHGAGVNDISALAFAPDSKSLISVDWKNGSPCTGDAHVWDIATGRRLRRFSLTDPRPQCLVFSPDGKTAAIGGAYNRIHGAIRIWDLRAGKEILSLKGHQGDFLVLAYSPDGRTLLSGCGVDQTVRLWEMATGKEIFTFKGHKQLVTSVAYSPNGRIIASGSGVNPYYPHLNGEPYRIRFWDAATGAELACREGHNANVLSLAFSPDGSRLASGLGNSTVLLWEAPKIPFPREGTVRLRPDELAALWSDLAGEDARKAHVAIWRLAASPKEAVPFLAKRLQPVSPPDESHLRQLIADLDSERFNVREAASKKLEALGEVAQPSLHRALAAHPPLEVRKRLEALLSQTRTLHGEALRGVRAMEVLEHIGGKQARDLLHQLSKGAAEARLTEEARATLQRLQRRMTTKER